MANSMFSLEGKVALVTGGTRGIGLAIGAALASARARVILLGRDRAALVAASRTIVQGPEASYVVADVADSSALDAAFSEVGAQFGRLDILVNNAGVEQLCASLEVDESLWNRIIGTNLKGAFFAAQRAAAMMEHGGVILNICSLTSEVGVPGAAPYGASKSGLLGLTRTLATEWAARGIRVNGIGPGYFRTQLTEAFYQDTAWSNAMLQKIPMRRFGQLDDLAGVAVFLASDASSYITGQVMYVDGGYLASI
jgi:NAD(P)-dependent dehydrogenase (short-subunit alcohol dehydrogenase family)